MNTPAAPLITTYDAAALHREAHVALEHVRAIQEQVPDLKSWVTFNLINQSGDADDLTLKPYAGECKRTRYAATMPYTMSIISSLEEQGFVMEYCRIAVLIGRDILRSHIDVHPSTRLILPLTEQGTDFRHVFGEYCFAMRVGELWGTNGAICHGAANVCNEGHRVALLVDARPNAGTLPPWWNGRWSIPDDHLVARQSWTDSSRQEIARRCLAAVDRGLEGAEREWLFVPFEFELTPAQAYREMIAFFQSQASRPNADPRIDWADRARHWEFENFGSKHCLDTEERNKVSVAVAHQAHLNLQNS